MMVQPLSIKENSSTSENKNYVNIWSRGNQHSSRSFTLSLIYCLFDSFIWLYPPYNIDTRLSLRNIKQTMILYALETLMFISFLHYDVMSIKDWSTYSEVWIAISFLRADKILTYSGMYHIWQAILNAIIYLPMAALLYLTLLGLYKKPLKFKYNRLLIKLPIFISTGIMIGPMSSGLYSLIKYRNSLTSYSQELSADITVISTSAGALAAIGLVLYVGFCILVKILCVEIRHDLAKFDSWAMASSNQEVLKVLWSFFLVFSYYFILPNISWMHFILISVSSGILCYLYFRRLPFYNPMMNKLQAMQFSTISFISFSHLLGYYLDSSTLILTMSFIITPIVVINISTVFDHYGKSRINDLKSRFYSIDTIQDFELAIRDILIKGDSSANEIFKDFYDHDVMKHEKLFYILDSYFTYATLDNKPLSRIKLSFIHQGNRSFEYDYYEYRCRICIENETDSESLRYMKYNSGIQAVKNADETLCRNLIELWEQLYSTHPSHNKIRKLVISIHKRRADLRKSYLNLIGKYTNVPYINELLGSLIVDICNKPSKGNRFLQKAAFQREDSIRAVNGNQLSFFYPDAGVIIISCDPNFFCRVIYANSQALQIIDHSHNLLIGTSLSSIIPHPYSEYHTKNIQNFILKRNMYQIDVHPKILFFTNQNARLVPVLCNIEMDVLGEHPCFLISVLKYEKCLDMAILSDDGIILSHTQDFPCLIGEAIDNMMGFDLYSSFPTLKDRYFKPFYLINDRRIIIVRITISSQLINLALVFRNFIEIEDFYSNGIHRQQTKEIAPELQSTRTDSTSTVPCTISFQGLEVGFADTDSLYLLSNQDLSDKTPEKRKHSHLEVNYEEEGDYDNRAPKKSLTYSSINSSFKGKAASSQSLSRIRSVHKATKSLKICLIVTTASILALIIGISIFIDEALEIMHQNSEVNNEMSQSLFYVHEMSHEARTINLITTQDYYQEDLSTVLTKLSTAIYGIRHMISSFDSYKNSISQEDKYFYENLMYQSSILTWELQDSYIKSYHENLMNILYDFTYHAQMVVNKTESLPILPEDPSLFYLLANSHGSAYDAFNQTYVSILEFQDNSIELMRTYILISFSSIGVVILICFVVIGHRLAILQKTSNTVWQMIYSIPLDSLIELKRRSVDRLLSVHNMILESTNEPVSLDKSSLRNVKYYNAWSCVSITFVFVLVLTIVYYIVIYYVIMEKVIMYIQLKPDLLYVSFESMVYNMLIYEWVRESVLDSTLYNLTHIIPEYKHTLTSQHEFAHNLQMYYKSISDMQNLIMEYSLNEPEIQELLYETQNTEHAILSKGLHYAQVAFYAELEEYKTYSSIQEAATHLKNLNIMDGVMIEYEYNLAIKIQDILDSKIDSYTESATASISVYCVVMLLCLLLIFIPTINRVDTNITYAWKFYLNFNLEDI